MFYIYRLTDEEQDYYGQTEDPEDRLGQHKCPSCECRSKLLDKSKFKMYIIHTLYTQEEANETEEFYQLNFPCVNKKITGRTRQEWRQSHKEEITAYKKEYYQKNKEEIREKDKKYKLEHKEEIAEKKAIYYQNHKAEIKAQRTQKYTCECGGRYTYSGKSQHLKSKKHQDYINSIE